MPTYAVRAPLARWLARGGRTGRRRPRAVPAARCRLRRDAVSLALPAPRPRGGRDGHLGQPARVAQGRHRVDPRRRRVVRRRPLRAGAGARRRSGPGRPRARARDAARRPGAAVDARRDGLPPEPGRPLALDRRGARAAVHGERRLGFRYGVRRLGHCLLPRDAERDLPRARSAADTAPRRARPVVGLAEPRRAGARPARDALRDERPGTIAANYHVVAERAP